MTLLGRLLRSLCHGLLSEEPHIPMEAVTKNDTASFILTGKVVMRNDHT